MTPRHLCRPPAAPRAALALLTSALLLALPAPAAAWDFAVKDHEFTLDLTDTFTYTYHFKDPDSPHYAAVGGEGVQLLKHQFYNTLDAALSHDVFRLGVRMDVDLFAGTAFAEQCDDPNSAAPGWCNQRDQRYLQHFALERIYFTVALPEFDLTLGDFYVSLGKGIALNLVKLQDLGQDNAVRGGKLVIHHGKVGMTFFGGQLSVMDIDRPTGMLSPWAEPFPLTHGIKRTPDALVGGRVELQPLDALIVGAHAVYVMTGCSSDWCEEVVGTGGRGNVVGLGSELMVGAGFEVPSLLDGALSFSGEVDLQRTSGFDGEIERSPWESEAKGRGVAAYGTVTGMVGDLTLLAEAKYYDDVELRAGKAQDESLLGYSLLYHLPPTLERITALVNNNFSVGGGRLRADYNFGELGPVELIAYLNFGLFTNWDNLELDRESGEQINVSRMVYNPYGGAELFWMMGEGTLKVTGGVRQEQDGHYDRIYMRDAFFELDAEQAFLGHHALKLSFRLLNRTKDQWEVKAFGQPPVREYKSWNEMELYLTYKWSPHLEAVFTYERQEDPQFERENYFGGGLRYYLNPSTYANLNVGQRRPGIKCLNGACRLFPAFSGVELTLVGRL